MSGKFSKLKVTVDKSHLLTLGERMYRESIEFLRELVNNTYDADATEVSIIIEDDKIVVEDNGSGMNEKGLEQFFTIGSEEKRIRSVSPRFGRKRIGLFGIGKFSALSLADQFLVKSVKGKYRYSVIFDKKVWRDTTEWLLPIEKEESSPFEREGTKVVLNALTKRVPVGDAEKYLKESVPLRAKKFNVYLNNKKITARTVPGKIIPIKIPTLYGMIEGEIIIALHPRDVDEPGLECRVKQVLIKRELFGLDKKYHHGVSRICGSINADFLPLVASRTDFIHDSPEYKLFFLLIKNKLEKILQELKKYSEAKNIKKITRELQEVMNQIREALLLNPDFVPQGRAVTRLKKQGRGELVAGVNIRQTKDDSDIQKEKLEENEGQKTVSEKPTEEKEEKEKPALEVKPLVMRRIRLKKLGISCGIVSLGENGPEIISQGNALYINQDYPLYQKFSKKRELLSLHLFRLITQELVLMKKLRITAQEAFKWQGKLLKDAICGG